MKVIILFITLFMLSCSSIGCYQSFHFVSGIKQKDMIVGTAIAYFPPSAGKINYNDWDIIQEILEEQLEVPQGYVAILPIGELICCSDEIQQSNIYIVKNINIIKGAK